MILSCPPEGPPLPRTRSSPLLESRPSLNPTRFLGAKPTARSPLRASAQPSHVRNAGVKPPVNVCRQPATWRILHSPSSSIELKTGCIIVGQECVDKARRGHAVSVSTKRVSWLPHQEPDHLGRRAAQRRDIGKLDIQCNNDIALALGEEPKISSSLARSSPALRTCAAKGDTSASSLQSRWLRFWSKNSFTPRRLQCCARGQRHRPVRRGCRPRSALDESAMISACVIPAASQPRMSETAIRIPRNAWPPAPFARLLGNEVAIMGTH